MEAKVDGKCSRGGGGVEGSRREYRLDSILELKTCEKKIGSAWVLRKGSGGGDCSEKSGSN